MIKIINLFTFVLLAFGMIQCRPFLHYYVSNNSNDTINLFIKVSDIPQIPYHAIKYDTVLNNMDIVNLYQDGKNSYSTSKLSPKIISDSLLRYSIPKQTTIKHTYIHTSEVTGLVINRNSSNLFSLDLTHSMNYGKVDNETEKLRKNPHLNTINIGWFNRAWVIDILGKDTNN
jgi:hypothetical protein